MHRMRPRDCPIVLRPLQLPAGPILRFSDDSLAVANYSEIIREKSTVENSHSAHHLEWLGRILGDRGNPQIIRFS